MSPRTGKNKEQTKRDCFVCGEPLVYSNEAADVTCYVCGKKVRANSACRKGHFVCDECHALDSVDLIMRFCKSTEISDPLEIALVLMRQDAIQMHGPEHHFLVPAVLITAHMNASGNNREKDRLLMEALVRSKQVPGGSCGYSGNCGAAVGAGIFVSIVTGATPLSKDEWKSANMATAGALRKVALVGGPRCCKRDSFISIIETTRYARKHMGSAMRIRKTARCEFNHLNRECLGKGCPFHRKCI